MNFTAPNHFSYNFKLDIDKTPSLQTDKFSLHLAIWGIISGILFLSLGAYEILGYFLHFGDQSYDFKLPPEMSLQQLKLLRYSFDSFILGFGLIIIVLSIISIKRRKTIYFDGEKIKIEHKRAFASTITYEEPLLNYGGVLLKIEYYQIGLITRNRYIIELYHQDQNKCVPLYISTSGKDIRKIWEQYATKLKMPALFITDHGLVSKHFNELNKTLKEMAKRWQLDTLYDETENIPNSIRYRSKVGRTVFKERRAFFDVYAVLTFILALVLCAICIWSVNNYDILKNFIGIVGFSALLSINLGLIFIIIVNLFGKDILVINTDNIILGHNFAMIRANLQSLPKEDIESVDIGHNPISGRYYLSIIAHNDSIVFGKNMPLADLRQIRGSIIREIVK